ncbi:MAG: 4-hydroxy-3-methylbut-2-enyl diphosphate reductase [Desulfobulbaceae bacterium]|nr:4-hydroxy-3-methylbut-2-enyl diphosphate reductase [Desulfobulbaceae bacterium]
MKVLLARHAGFCMGVRRAVETTLDMLHHEPHGLATFGPLIHNPQVLDLLRERGVTILKEIPAQATGTIIIRAHGVPPEQKKSLEATGAKVKDATCPRVLKVQAIIKKHHRQGYTTVIIGDRNHAEVDGLLGYAAPSGLVVSNEAEAAALELTGPYIIVSQTTQDENTFETISRLIVERFPDGKVFNTICDSTHKRQDEVRELCRQVEALVVVGGRTSANTMRLGEIADSMGCPVFMVETEEELDLAGLRRYDCVGVTAGASTPTWMINRVVRTLESIPGKGQGMIRPLLSRLFWLLLATNLYVSLGGGLLALVGCHLQTIPPHADFFLVAFGYLFAMHNLNRFTDRKSDKFSDPVQTLFYRRYRWPLFVVSSLALAVSLTVAAGLGPSPLMLLIAMSVLGVLYSVPIFPKPLSQMIKVRGLKEIPGSKTFFVAMAWTFVTVLLPAMSQAGTPGGTTIGAFFFVFLLVYVRSALFDVFEVLGDRIVGKETLPVSIGEKKTMALLHLLLGLQAAILLILPIGNWLAGSAFLLLPAVLYLALIGHLYGKGKVRQGAKLEFALESVFLLVALLSWLGSRLY